MFGMAFEGGDELARNLANLPSRVSRRVQIEALMEGGEPIRALASQKAPRHPGAPDLADNINMAVLRKRAGDDPKEISVGIGVPRAFFYDWFLEYGTVHMGPHAFWRPAFDPLVPKALESIGNDLWTSLAGRGFTRSASVSTAVQSSGRFL